MPTTTKAANPNLRPPLTTFVILLIATSFSFISLSIFLFSCSERSTNSNCLEYKSQEEEFSAIQVVGNKDINLDEDIVKEGIPRSQAHLARRIGRTRATVHSAVKVLRRRGILRDDRIELMPHIDMNIEWHGTRGVDYEWLDERR